MSTPSLPIPMEDGLTVVGGPDLEAHDLRLDDDAPLNASPGTDADLEALRDEFVDAFNARDLDAVLAVVREDVETPEIASEGAANLADQLDAIWGRWPGAILTRAYLDDQPCAVAWLPDEEGCWSRAALVCFDGEGGLLTVVAMPEDADGLDRAEAEDPTGDELEEWSDWSSWDRGEETVSRPRQ